MPAFRNYPTSTKQHGAEPLDLTLEGRLRAIIATVAGLDEGDVTLNADLRADLHLDSLDLTEILMRCDEELGVQVDDAFDLDRLRSFENLLELVTGLAGEIEGAGGEGNDAPLGLRSGGGAMESRSRDV